MDAAETTDELLNDPGDLVAGEFTPEPEPEVDGIEITAVMDERTIANINAMTAVDDNDPVHLAKCAECAEAVRFRPNVTGTGFFLVDADPDAIYGVGALGRPVCPNGHGEMGIADDQLKPASEAFADAQGMLLKAEAEAAGRVAVRGDLPGILPVFNYQGCYLELEEKAAEVNALHEEYLEAKEAASDAKKAWDKAAELYTKMALEFRRRRQAKGDTTDAPTQADPPTRALVCTWDQQHPDDACPFCSPFGTTEFKDEFVRVLGADIAPKDAQAHADQVVEYRTKVDVEETVEALEFVLFDIHRAQVAGWTPEQRATVREWIAAVNAAPDVMSEPPFPAELGRPHRAGVVQDGEQAQRCVSCTETIKTFDDPSEAFPVMAYVRTDCQGEQPEVEHHYPDTAKPKKRTRGAKAESERPAKKTRGGKARA